MPKALPLLVVLLPFLAMKIFLMRHAEASPTSPDPARELSLRGERISRAMAAFLKGNTWFAVSEIWSSTYTRAIQTAECVREGVDASLPITQQPFLTPESDPETALQVLQKVEQPILVVGHNPHLSLLASTCLGLSTRHHYLPFKKSALMALSKDPLQASGWTLSAYLTPKSLNL